MPLTSSRVASQPSVALLTPLSRSNRLQNVEKESHVSIFACFVILLLLKVSPLNFRVASCPWVLSSPVLFIALLCVMHLEPVHHHHYPHPHLLPRHAHHSLLILWPSIGKKRRGVTSPCTCLSSPHITNTSHHFFVFSSAFNVHCAIDSPRLALACPAVV